MTLALGLRCEGPPDLQTSAQKLTSVTVHGALGRVNMQISEVNSHTEECKQVLEQHVTQSR